MSSWTFFAGTDGFTTRMFGASAIRAIGAKSFTGSYGSFDRPGLMPCVAM